MIKRIQVSFVLVCFVFNLGLPNLSFALNSSDTFLNLPAPGTMLSTSPAFTPAIVRGLQIDPKNPLQFNFIVDTGDAHVQGEELRAESSQMIKYFLAALTVPEKELWVNLSPYEKDRIIANGLGQTEMGRDMLAQDYVLKQLTASMIYPEGSLGKTFWAKVYKKAQEQFGTTNVPVNTFNKVWIVPDHATIYEHNGTAFITENKLKVMLEQDYLSLQKHMNNAAVPAASTSTLGSQIIRETVLPELEKEINTGKNFAQLRQIANAVVLATWYKMNLKQSLLGQLYANQNKVAGVDVQDKNTKMEIYNQYLKAFKKGVYNYIKEDIDPLTNQTVPRKYFSGGTEFEAYAEPNGIRKNGVITPAMLSSRNDVNVLVNLQAIQGTPEASSAMAAKPEDVRSQLTNLNRRYEGLVGADVTKKGLVQTLLGNVQAVTIDQTWKEAGDLNILKTGLVTKVDALFQTLRGSKAFRASAGSRAMTAEDARVEIKRIETEFTNIPSSESAASKNIQYRELMDDLDSLTEKIGHLNQDERDELDSSIGRVQGTIRSASGNLTVGGRTGPASHDLAMKASDVNVLGQFGDNITEIENQGTGTLPIQDMIRQGMTGVIISHSETLLELTRKFGMIRDENHDFVIGGKNINETIFAPQVKMAFDHGLKDVILALGETGDEKELGLTKQVILRDIVARLSLVKEDLTKNDNAKRLIIAYEPRWAIGKEPATPQEAQEIAEYIRAIFKEWYGGEIGERIAQQVRILYGGAADGNNAANFMAQKDIDGLLVGGKSLDVATAKPMLDALQAAGVKDGRIPYFGANWKTNRPKSEFIAFGKLFKQYDNTRVNIGVGPIATQIKALFEALKVMGVSRDEQLNYNKKAMKQFSEHYRDIAKEKETPILEAIASLPGASAENALTVRRSLVVSSEGAPRTTVVGPDGKVKYLDSFGSIHVSEGLSSSDQTSVILAPGERGKVAHQMTIVIPGEVTIDTESLRRALRSGNISVRPLSETQSVQPQDNVVVDSNSVYVKVKDGITQIDLNLFYDVGNQVDGTLETDNPLIANGLEVLQGSQQEASEVFNRKSRGQIKNVLINGANGRIGTKLLQQWLLAGPESNVNIVLANGVSSIQGLIKMINGDSVHGTFLVAGRDKVNIGSDNGVEYIKITYKGKMYNKIYRLNDRSDYSKLPLGAFDVEIAVDAIVNGETYDNLMKYIEAGAIRVIHTSPSKKGIDGKKAFALVFGLSEDDFKGQDVCQSTSCTSVNVSTSESALMREGGPEGRRQRDLNNQRLEMLGQAAELNNDMKTETMHLRTVHAATNSDSTVDNKRASAIANMGRLETTGASRALVELNEDLKDVVMSADSLRYVGANMSLSEVTKVVTIEQGQNLTADQVKDQVKKLFVDASKSPRFKRVFRVIEGGFDSKQLQGSQASATILLDSIEVVKVKGKNDKFMIHYKSWYDNEWGFTARIWDIILSTAEDMERNLPQSDSVEDLLTQIDDFNSKYESDIISYNTSGGAIKIEAVNHRNALVAQYGLMDYLRREAAFNPNKDVRREALGIVQQVGHLLGVQSASRQVADYLKKDHNVSDKLVPFNPGSGSGSRYAALLKIYETARDTGIVPQININEPNRRKDVQQKQLAVDTLVNPKEEAETPKVEDLEPGFVEATVADVYAAAIAAGWTGPVFLNLNNVSVNPDFFTPQGESEGKDWQEGKIENPFKAAVKDVKARILQAAKAGVYNYQIDLTPLLAYGAKNARGGKTQDAFIYEAAVELTTFIRALENEINFRSAPLSVSFTVEGNLISEELKKDINNELRESKLALPTYIGDINALKEKSDSLFAQDPRAVMFAVLNQVVEAAKDKDNVDAIDLRNDMINFMEGLVYKNKMASRLTKDLIAQAALRAAGQRFNRHRRTLLKAREMGLKQSGSLDQIHDMILTRQRIEGLNEKEQITLEELVEYTYRAFYHAISHLRVSEGADKVDALFAEEAQKLADANKDKQGKAREEVRKAVNAPFMRDPRKTIQPTEGRTLSDKYQDYHVSVAGKVTQYAEPELTTPAIMDLQLDKNGNMVTGEEIPGVYARENTLTTAIRTHSRLAGRDAMPVRSLQRGAADARSVASDRRGAVQTTGTTIQDSKIEQMMQWAFAGKSERFKANLERLYRYGVLGGTRRLVILPIDQATEHSPSRSHEIYTPMANKDNQVELAYRLGLSGYAALAGTIEMIAPRWSRKIPLIAKVNMSSGVGGNPKASQHSALIGNVEQLAKAGVAAIGYTIYPGSLEFNEQMNELRQVIDEANKYDLPVITWSYPRGGERLAKSEYETAFDVSIAAANMALEAGAAIVKVKPPANVIMDEKEEKELIKKYQGKVGSDKFMRVQLDMPSRIEKMKQLGAWGGVRDLIFSGGPAKSTEDVLKEIADVAFGGGNGAIVGRNMFQRQVDEAVDLGNKILALEIAGAWKEDGIVSFNTVDEMMEYAFRDNRPGDILYDIKADFQRRNPDWDDFKARLAGDAAQLANKAMVGLDNIVGKETFDSRGNPTVEVTGEVKPKGSEIFKIIRARVPSGASTGKHEAWELRDGDKSYYNGKGVFNAIRNINEVILPALKAANIDILDDDVLKKVDDLMNALDGTPNKSRLGANAILGVSMLITRAAAEARGISLEEFLNQEINRRHKLNQQMSIPVPMMNFINGGAHVGGVDKPDVQEYMVQPVGAKSIEEALANAEKVFKKLGEIAQREYGIDPADPKAYGNEKGYALPLKSNEEGLELLKRAIIEAGFTPGKDFTYALDVASTEFYKDGVYTFEKQGRTSQQMIQTYAQWKEKYPELMSIEDGLAEDDWESWADLTKAEGNHLQLVGDDLFVTNVPRLRRGIAEKSANAVLIKVNQIGTISETLDAIAEAIQNGYGVIISHRSGETEDDFISHLAVGTGAGQIKTGGLAAWDAIAAGTVLSFPSGRPTGNERKTKYVALKDIEKESNGTIPYAALLKATVGDRPLFRASAAMTADEIRRKIDDIKRIMGMYSEVERKSLIYKGLLSDLEGLKGQADQDLLDKVKSGFEAEIGILENRIRIEMVGSSVVLSERGFDISHKDSAMRAKRDGGINFDPSMYSIQIRRDGNGIPLPVDQQPIARINVRGFRGIIMSITPANLPQMLGLVQSSQTLAMNN